MNERSFWTAFGAGYVHMSLSLQIRSATGPTAVYPDNSISTDQYDRLMVKTRTAQNWQPGFR